MLRRVRPSPPSAGLGLFPSASAFSFPLPFQGSPVLGQVCWCWCSLLVPPLLFCVPRLVFPLSNFHLIFIFISSSSPFHPHFHFTVRTSVAHPAGRCVCVCVEHLNRCKTSTVAFCDSSSSHLAGGLEPICLARTTKLWHFGG